MLVDGVIGLAGR